MIELYYKLHCEFTDSEKEKCIYDIHRMVELAAFIRKHGILSMEDRNNEEPNFFLKTGMQLAIDAATTDVIKEILQTLILADNRKGAELLSRMIIAQGIIYIVNGYYPKQIEQRLAAMLGEEYLKKFQEGIYATS